MTDFSKPSSANLQDIIMGKVPGFEYLSIPGENTSVGPSLVNLTGVGGLQILASAGETWEIVSTDANDTLAGTGARTVQISSLDENYVEQTTTAEMDGLTPVVLAGTHLRVAGAIVRTVGSNAANTNIGDITIQVAGGGAERTMILAGSGVSKDLIFTVPAGKTAFSQSVTLFCTKNRDGQLLPRVTPLNGATAQVGLMSTYQNEQAVLFPPPLTLPEKTDLVIDCRSTNAGTTIFAVYSFILADNTKLP